MKNRLAGLVVTFLLLAGSSPCSAQQEITQFSRAKAEEMGVTSRTNLSGPTGVSVAEPQAAPYGPKLTALRSRIDGRHDWTPAEAVARLDELTAITTGPVHLAKRPFEFDESRKGGTAIPAVSPEEDQRPASDADDTSKKEAKPVHPRLAEDRYAKIGVPLAEQTWPMPPWGAEKDGLSAGLRVIGDARIGGQVKAELWVRNSSAQDVKFSQCLRADVGLSFVAKDKDGKEQSADITQFRGRPVFQHLLLPSGHGVKVKEFSVKFGAGKNDKLEPGWVNLQLTPGDYELRAVWSDTTSRGAAEGEWSGKLTTRELNVVIVAPDAPAPKPRIEHVSVRIGKDGEVSLDRKKMSLDELKTRAARNAKRWFTIEADEDVPYAKVIEVVEALKAVGLTDFSFAEARVGDGRYRVANRQASYKLDDKHRFSICRPSERPQWFTVSWPAEGERLACWLRTFPNVSEQTQGKWAVVWEPGTDVLWWVDDTDVGKMTLSDPARVIVDREGRKNNFSRDFGLPEEVKTEFRRLGFEIGREPVNGHVPIGGNTGGQSIVSAEAGNWIVEGTVTDADGKPMKDVPVRLTTNQELKTEKTDEKGNYRAYFSLPIQLLAHWRAVTVEPVVEGFTERNMAKAGEFNALLRAGEQPQRVRLTGDQDFQPGPIPRFAERDLVTSQPGVSPGNPGRADFVMLRAGEITGEIVTADGKPAPPHWVAAATPEQRPGHNAAIVLSDAQGRFRLKGIPTNKPVIFTVNPDGKPGETSKSSEQKFEQTGTHKVRVILPAEGSGKGPVKIERFADGPSAPAGKAIRGKVLKPDGTPAAGVQLRADRIYMRKGDNPAFLWRREGVEKREAAHLLELGVADRPQTIGLTVQDAGK